MNTSPRGMGFGHIVTIGRAGKPVGRAPGPHQGRARAIRAACGRPPAAGGSRTAGARPMAPTAHVPGSQARASTPGITASTPSASRSTSFLRKGSASLIRPLKSSLAR